MNALTLKDCFAKRRARILKRKELAATFMKLRRDAIEFDWDDEERADFEDMSDREFLDLHCPKQPWRERLRNWWKDKKQNFKNKFRGPVGYQGAMGCMGERGERGPSGLKCPHCDNWSSDVKDSKFESPAADPKYSWNPLYVTYHCGACKLPSEWFTGAPMFIAAEDVKITFLKPHPAAPETETPIQPTL